jgi:predicted MFS family arabinose efflux permease
MTLPMLMLIATFSIPHVSSMSPFLTEMADDFDVSEGLAGQLATVSFAGSFVIAVVLTPFVDRLSLRRLMAIALVVVGISTFFTAIIPSFWLVMATRVLAGLGGGMIGSSVLGSAPRAWTDPATRLRRLGLVIASFAAGPGLWAPFMRILADGSSWQSALVVYSIASVVIGVLVWGLLPDLRGVARAGLALSTRISGAVKLAWYPVLGQVYLTRAISVAIFGAIIGFIAGFIDHFYPGSEAWIGPMIAATAIGFMVSALASGALINRIGGAANASLYFLLASAVITSLLIWVTPDPMVTIIFLFLWGASAAIVMSATQEILFTHSGEHQVSAVFLSGAISPLGNVFGVIFGGIAFDAAADLTPFRWYITVLGFLAIPPMLMVIRQIRAQRELEPVPAPAAD